MRLWTLWLCAVLLIGSAAASDVPFVFDEETTGVANYTSNQFEEASTSSINLIGVPFSSTPQNDETLEFPVTGGGNSPSRTTEKKVEDLKNVLDSKVEPDNPAVIDEVGLAAGKYSGDRTIEQISAIYDYLKEGWHYLGDPRGLDYFKNASESLNLGKKNDCVGVGDCDDFAILMAGLVESIGGTTRIILARNNTTGGHAYAEVYLGQINATNSQVEDIISWLELEYETDKIYTHIDTDTKDVWLNLDWGADEKGNAHPGGPFYPGDKHYIICIRDTYGKTPLKLPEKANKPPTLISLTSDKADPQESGASITWTANAKDPEKDQVSYRFFINDESETSWTSDNTWTWQTTDDDIGQNQVEVRVRDGKHKGPNRFDDSRITCFNITEPSIVEAPTEPSTSTDSANTIPSAGMNIVFPDLNLEAVIRETINKPEGAIYASDLEKITSLNDSGSGYEDSESDIKDITGLEYCTNLKEINLSYNQITDVSPLAGLTNLQYLDLHFNPITDVTPLAGLTNLQELILGNNQITDVTPLARLNNLHELYLGDNQISDVSPLARLNNLQTLWLNDNQITDVSSLAGLINLQDLELYGTQITDTSPLSGLTGCSISY